MYSCWRYRSCCCCCWPEFPKKKGRIFYFVYLEKIYIFFFELFMTWGKKKSLHATRHSFRDMSKDLHHGEKPKSEHTTTTNNNNFVIWVKQRKYSTSNEEIWIERKIVLRLFRKMFKICTWEVWETIDIDRWKKEALPVRNIFPFRKYWSRVLFLLLNSFSFTGRLMKFCQTRSYAWFTRIPLLPKPCGIFFTVRKL